MTCEVDLQHEVKKVHAEYQQKHQRLLVSGSCNYSHGKNNHLMAQHKKSFSLIWASLIHSCFQQKTDLQATPLMPLYFLINYLHCGRGM